MKVTCNWLKELTSVAAPVDEIAQRLTAAGLEVASCEPRTIPDGVVVGEIVDVEKLPDADHLYQCNVSIGKGAPQLSLCGAPNTHAGIKAAFATAGTVINPNLTIKKTTIYGVESSGMLCSERELGISESHEGIIYLPDEFRVGDPLNKYIENDTIIEIDLTPNRGDCLSVLGVAREVSALYNLPVQDFALTPKESSVSIDTYMKVAVEDHDACPRYMGRLIEGVSIKESPLWLKNRLSALGIRPISNVVDITNYILLLFGQPMHSFDYNEIAGKEIIIKRAKKGQKFTTLDEVERTLTSEDLLICDAHGPTALAGIMGGLTSGITEKTHDVFLECAFFNPVGVRKTSKRLDLSTDSSYRFERGVDPAKGLEKAIDMAAAMIQEIAGGSVAKGVIDACSKQITKRQISLRPSRIKRILGIAVEKSTIVEMLASLQITQVSENNEMIVFEVPTYRHDLSLEVDLIEEVGRVYGYDNIPTKMNSTIVMDHQLNPIEKTVSTIRKTLCAGGLHEAVSGAMISHKMCTLLSPDIQAVELLNPLNPDMSCMRTTLLGSLLDITAYNINRKNKNNHFFEIGKAFIIQDNASQPHEIDTVAILLEGDYMPASWNSSKQKTDFFILKGYVESIQRDLNLPQFTYSSLSEAHAFFSEESARFVGRGIRGIMGKINENVLNQFKIKTPVYFAELDINKLLNSKREKPLYSQLPKFPAINRDFCFVMEESLPSSAISDEIFSVSELVESVDPFDVYRGDNLQTGQKSIAYSIKLRAADRTLTDKEAEDISSAIIKTMKSRFKAELRV